MMVPFLYLTNVLLLTRLPLFLQQGPTSRRHWIAVSLVQISALFAFRPSWPVLGLASVTGALCCLGWIWERRLTPRLTARRLVLLAAYILAFSVLCAPAMNLQFQPVLIQWANQMVNAFVPASLLSGLSWANFHGGLCGLLLSLNESNLLVRFIVERYELRPREKKSDKVPGVLEPVEYNRGRVIGMLERLLVFFFVLTDQLAALGFVLAIKGIARFKNLEDRDFAEYFLIGTLISVISAGSMALVTRHFLIQ